MSKINPLQINGLPNVNTSGLTASQHTNLRQLIHLADGVGGPFDGFLSGAFRVQDASILPSTITWYVDDTMSKKIVQKNITYQNNINPSSIEWIVYDIDGISILADVVDTIYYNGMFETHRVRSINNYISSSVPMTSNNHETVRQLIHLADGVGGPFEGFASGAVRKISPSGSPFPSAIIWYVDNTMSKKIIEKNITYTSRRLPSNISWILYSGDGITKLLTISDSISYDKIYEISRTRTFI